MGQKRIFIKKYFLFLLLFGTLNGASISSRPSPDITPLGPRGQILRFGSMSFRLGKTLQFGKGFSLVLTFGFLALSSCGNGNMLGNGSGSPGTALGALQVANSDIASGNYSGAIAVLAPYCPNNNCVNADIANADANAYIAMGNTATGTSITGLSTATASSNAGATITQILSTVLNLVNSNPSSNNVLQGVVQAIPCLSNNTCNTTYLDNLATAIQVLANTPCSGPSSVATNCPDSSSILLASAVYLLAVAQYETGIVYNNNTWETCGTHGGGLGGTCTQISTSQAQESALANDLVLTTNAKNRLQNIAHILGANCNSTTDCGTATITIPSGDNALNALPFFLASLGTSNTNIVQSFYQFLNSLSQCSASNATSGCWNNASGTSASSLNINKNGIAWYLSQL